METPSSTRRVTRSQTLAAMNSPSGNIPLPSKKQEDYYANCQSKSRQVSNKERSALIDITNDSPIVGVAMQTPSSGMTTTKKKKSRLQRTPGSGEALLRGQVKTLLQQVEEEAHLTKLTRPSFIHLVTSPMALVAPTPANTPQVPNFDPDADEVDILIVEEQLRSSEEEVLVVGEGKEESPSSLCISRSLLLDFSDKSESSSESFKCASALLLTQKGEIEWAEDDSSSVWSMQVNASTADEADDDDDQVYCLSGEEVDEEEEGEGEEGDLDGLCEGMRKMSVEGEKSKTVVEFAGKHSRFVYDSEGEEIVDEQSVLHLKGIPTPMGKHVRFGVRDDEDP